MMTVLCLCEIALLTVVAFVLLRQRCFAFAESVTFAILMVLALLSCTIQFAFLVRLPALSLGIEGLFCAGGIVLIIARRRRLSEERRVIRQFTRKHALLTALFGATWTYLALQAILLPPGNYDSMTYNLARVLLFEQERTLFLSSFTTARQIMHPVGSDILAHIFLRFGNDFGVGIFSFLAYIAIGFGTYALTKRRASVFVAPIAALIVLSLPELTYQATSTKNDLITIAAAVGCLLAADRLCDRLKLEDFLLLMVAIVFGISAKTTFFYFLLPFALLYGFPLVRRYGLSDWRLFAIRHRHILIGALFPALILSQAWLFAHNYQIFGDWRGPEHMVAGHSNTDGLVGTFANLFRYSLQTIHLLTPVDLAFQLLTGKWLSGEIQHAYETLVFPLWHNAGAIYPFAINWSAHEDFSWFGPLGFLLVVPAIIYTVLRAPFRLRVIAMTLLGYALLLSWQLAWMPWNNRFFALFFACSGVCVGYMLSKWPKPATRMTTVVASFILLYASAFNVVKPLFPSLHWPPSEMVTRSLRDILSAR